MSLYDLLDMSEVSPMNLESGTFPSAIQGRFVLLLIKNFIRKFFVLLFQNSRPIVQAHTDELYM